MLNNLERVVLDRIRVRSAAGGKRLYSPQFIGRLTRMSRPMDLSSVSIIRGVREEFFTTKAYRIGHAGHVKKAANVLEDSARAFPELFLEELPAAIERGFPQLEVVYAIFRAESPFPGGGLISYGGAFAWSRIPADSYVCQRKEGVDASLTNRARGVCRELATSSRKEERRVDDDLIARRLKSEEHYLGSIVLRKKGELLSGEQEAFEQMLGELSDLLNVSQILNRERESLFGAALGAAFEVLEYGAGLVRRLLK